MLFRTLAEAIGDLLLTLFGALPDFGVSWPWAAWTVTVPTWFPVDVVAWTLATALAVNAVLITFTLSDWAWRHIPQVFGTGPGAG